MIVSVIFAMKSQELLVDGARLTMGEPLWDSYNLNRMFGDLSNHDVNTYYLSLRPDFFNAVAPNFEIIF